MTDSATRRGRQKAGRYGNFSRSLLWNLADYYRQEDFDKTAKILADDESCWVYIDGKEAGKRICTSPDDWKNPFAIRIDQTFDDVTSSKQVMVRVEDTAGMGGIWKPVWVAVKPESP